MKTKVKGKVYDVEQPMILEYYVECPFCSEIRDDVQESEIVTCEKCGKDYFIENIF